MGYRKSAKIGGIRVTASKSGISYSAGVKGARVTKLANGRVRTTVTVPGIGGTYTSTSGASQKRSAVASPTPKRSDTVANWIGAAAGLLFFFGILYLFFS